MQLELVNITQQIYKSSQRLSKGPSELFNLARKSAEAEKAYRKALAMEIMKLRLEGLPATLIADVARGNCADLKWARDLAELEYQSGRESLKAIQIEVSALQTILKYQTEV